jgi:hypothetical protein
MTEGMSEIEQTPEISAGYKWTVPIGEKEPEPC